MSTNQERRAEARQRLREQMEAQARREKQLKIGAAAVVVVVLAGIVGVVVWNNVQQSRAEEYAATWAECEYPEATERPEKVDPAEFEGQDESVVAEAEEFNDQVDLIIETERFVDPPTGDQARHGTAEITLTTGQGEIPLSLDRNGAPCNVASFVHLTEQGFFDDSECHRLTVPSDASQLAVLQCGDPTGTGMSGPGYSIVDEPPTNLETDPQTGTALYPRGTLAMAKSQAPDSAGSQFFLVYEDSTLPPEYTVMGTIGDEGLEVLDEIADAGVESDDPTDPGNQVPAEEVMIESAELVSQAGLPED